MKTLTHLATRVFNTAVMIHPAKLEAIVSVLMQRMESGSAPQVAVANGDQGKRKPYKVTREGVAVISVVGPLVKRASGEFLSGGPTTYGEIENEFMDAATDPDIKGILLDMDSPGGEVGGLFELAEMIHGQRGAKPIYAVANNDCFSAAYAIASAAERIYITRSGGVGSVGVIAMHVDQSELDSNLGLKYTFITAGARKKDFNPHEPLSDSAAENLQAEINRLYGLFASTVARNRSLSVDSVKATEAGLFFGDKAIAAGLADREGSMDDALRDMIAVITQKSRSLTLAADAAQSKKEASMPEQKETPEKTPAPRPPQEPEPKETAVDIGRITAEAESRGFDLASEIAQLCQIAGKPALAVEYITKKMSVSDVRTALIAVRAEADTREIESRSTVVGAASGFVALETAAVEVARKSPGVTREMALADMLKANPSVYDQYLKANPIQTGGRW